MTKIVSWIVDATVINTVFVVYAVCLQILARGLIEVTTVFDAWARGVCCAFLPLRAFSCGRDLISCTYETESHGEQMHRATIAHSPEASLAGDTPILML